MLLAGSSFRVIEDERWANSHSVPNAGSRLSARLASGACTGGVPRTASTSRVDQLMHGFFNSSACCGEVVAGVLVSSSGVVPESPNRWDSVPPVDRKEQSWHNR